MLTVETSPKPSKAWQKMDALDRMAWAMKRDPIPSPAELKRRQQIRVSGPNMGAQNPPDFSKL